MKQVKIGMLVFAILSFTAATAQSEKKKSIEGKIAGQFDKTMSKLEKVNIVDTKEVKKVAEEQLIEDWLVEEALRLLNEEIARSDKEIQNKRKEYVPASSNRPQQIDKDLLPLLSGMPEPVTSLPEAKKTMKPRYDETIYATYIEKLERYKIQMKDAARKTIPDNMKNPELMKKEAYRNAAKAQQDINNNPVIREMGGIEKLKDMTPEQRQAFAKQMAAKVKQTPSAYTGNQGDPKKAFAQKMMTDPNYAARFNHMNEQQKKEEYEAFKTDNGFVDNSSQADKDKINGDRNRTATSIAIDKRISVIQTHTDQLLQIVSPVQKRTKAYFNDLNKKISDQYARIGEALPEVEHGEAGKGKDTHPLNIAYNILIYPVNAQNAIANKEMWKREVDILKILIAESNELLSDFWGKDKVTDQLMAEKGLTPAAITVGMCDAIISLTKKAGLLTNQNASWQRTYDEKVLELYE